MRRRWRANAWWRSSAPTWSSQIANTQFIGNSAVNGGALHHGGASNDVSISSSRFEDNSASTSGGAVFDVRICTTDTPFLASTAASLLAPLADTSGTMLTHALLAGGPAIDRGDAVTCTAAPIDGVDQRAGARNVGSSCDIGAHEQGAVVSMTMFGDGFEGE